MGSIGDVSTTAAADRLGFRSPIGDAGVFEVSDVRGFTAGTFAVRSDALILPLQTVTSGIIVAAYEVQRLVVDCLPVSAIYSGQELCFRLGTGQFEAAGSDVAKTAIALEAKAGGVSELMVHFNGYGMGDTDTSTSDVIPPVIT